MSTINAYITFNGNCHEAMKFYQDALGGELTLQSVGGMPVEARCPAGEEQQIMHSQLMKGNMVLMGTDMLGPAGFIQGTTMSLALQCDTAEEINTYFANLSQGGQVVEPLGKQAWGPLWGMLIDRYGVAWMLNHDLKEGA
ncbi:VOC family protein [Chitinophaga alhagiae]|uniref:VOC family protein n=1 Tax=Chitinophaga alhagiae TaxID=2203219 RepID=A0ABM6WEE9_9BACT|nr:VOC family protein [Chitinophaga alhagiae]AWO02231.1 VOC family protein [Chitinophaga alhagiae]